MLGEGLTAEKSPFHIVFYS